MRWIDKDMKTYKKYFPSAMFSGEIILSDKSYDTYEEAKANTDFVFPDVDWEEYDENNHLLVRTSYGRRCEWMN